MSELLKLLVTIFQSMFPSSGDPERPGTDRLSAAFGASDPDQSLAGGTKPLHKVRVAEMRASTL
jgi:hypothetical protein